MVSHSRATKRANFLSSSHRADTALPKEMPRAPAIVARDLYGAAAAIDRNGDPTANPAEIAPDNISLRVKTGLIIFDLAPFCGD